MRPAELMNEKLITTRLVLNGKPIQQFERDLAHGDTLSIDVTGMMGSLTAERDALLQVVQAYEEAHEALFVQCCSNPIKNTWGKEVSVLKLNEAHQMAGRVLREHVFKTQPPEPARRTRPPAPPPEHCDGDQSKCKWVPDGAGSKCQTCGDSIPF